MKSISFQSIAAQSKMTFDIPPRMRKLLIVAGLVGLVLVIMESIIGGKPYTIESDKIIHFSGYAVLSIVFVLGLKPILLIPAMVALAGVGIGIEFIQETQGRSSSVGDMIANSVGIGFGLVCGLIIRFVYNYLRKELAVQRVKKKLLKFKAGEIVLKQGQPIDKYYLVKKGKLELIRYQNGVAVGLSDVVGAGQIIGALGLILNKPQYSDVIALEDSEIYGMSFEELIESAGGIGQPISMLLIQAAEYIVKVDGLFEEQISKDLSI